MENDSQVPIELRFAWRQRQQEIDDFIRRLPSKNISTAFITAQHGGGKSTTLLTHISDLIQQDEIFERTAIVYLMPSHFEAETIYLFLLGPNFDPDAFDESRFSAETAPTKVLIDTFEYGVKWFDEITSHVGKDCDSLLLMLDLEIHSTTQGEVLLGLTMEWAAKASTSTRKGNGLVVLSSYNSPRTIQTMTRVVGHPPEVVTIPEVNFNVGMNVLNNDTFGHLRQLMQGQGNFVLAHYDSSWEVELENAQLIITYFTGNAATARIELGADNHIMVHPQFPSSCHLTGLTHVVSSCKVERLVFRPEVAQPALQVRNVNRLEFLRELSWAHKTLNPNIIDFYHPAGFNANSLLSGIDMLGPAMLDDRYHTVLELVARWPGQALAQMPARDPQHIHILRDICRKLKLFRCIENVVLDGQPADSIYKVSDFGESLRALWREDRPFRTLDFHAIHLVTPIFLDPRKWSTNYIRVAFRLAAIMSFGGRFCGKEFPDRPQSLEQLQEQCVGLGRERANLGGAWAAFVDAVRSDTVRYNGLNALKILEMVHTLEGSIGFDKVTDEVGQTELTETEVDELENALLGAWIDQLAFYIKGQGEGKWYEAATAREVQATKSDFLDPTSNLDHGEFDHGCHAFYSSISEEGGAFVVFELTAVSQRATKAFGDKIGMAFSEAIASRYPLSQQEQISLSPQEE
ncbi:hypothetical protein PG990_008658 [Apiospora arundinis]